MIKNYLFLLVCSIAIISCTKENLNTSSCTIPNLGVTNQDTAVVTNGRVSPWKVRYTETEIELYRTTIPQLHGEHDTIGYVFRKVTNLRGLNTCLEFSYGYRHGTGAYGNIDIGKTVSITKAPVYSYQIQQWVENERLVGQLVVPTNLFGGITTLKFWVEYDEDDYYEYENNTPSASECIDPFVPIHIDINNDGVNDFSFKNEVLDYSSANIFNLSRKINSFKVIPLNNNSILYKVPLDFSNLVFEPPFSTQNASETQMPHFTNNTLAILEEFEPPYDRFDYWHFHNVSIHYYHPDHPQYGFANDIDDYILVKLEKDGQYYYGWIKLLVKNHECVFEVLETYINPVANQHVSVP